MVADRKKKLDKLIDLLSSLPAAAVAFSGGVDSSLLAKCLFDAQGERSLAITVDSMFIPRQEIAQAQQTAQQIGIRHLLVTLPSFPDNILVNDRERCYHCKKLIFSTIKDVAEQEGAEVLLDGSNVDDLGDFRPGMKALKELGIQSPLLQCAMTKDDIRALSKEFGLATWDHPAMACLASRVVYGQYITGEVLGRVEKAEDFLRKMGLKQVRVRCHGDLARIEVATEEREKFFTLSVMDRVSIVLKDFGFNHVSLDLEGYVTGKLNRK